MCVEGVHQDDLTELACFDDRRGGLDPFSEQAAIEGMKVVPEHVSVWM